MGTCCETICKHRILFPSIQHLPWFPQGVPRGNQNVVKTAIFGFTHWLKHRITRKLLKTDMYIMRGVWQALNCLSIHARYCVLVAGASPGESVECRWGRQKTRFLTNNWRYSMYWTDIYRVTLIGVFLSDFRINYLHQTCTQYSSEGPQHWNAAQFPKISF